MKKLLSLVLVLVLVTCFSSAMAEDERISLNELFELCWDEACYPAGLLSVNCVVTETAQFRLDIWVDSTRVDYHLLSDDEWDYDTERGIMVNRSIFNTLIENPEEGSGEFRKLESFEKLRYGDGEWMSIFKFSDETFEDCIYGSGMLNVDVKFTEVNSIILEVYIDDERVDYHLLSEGEWKFDELCGVLVSQDAVEKLVSDVDAPSGI